MKTGMRKILGKLYPGRFFSKKANGDRTAVNWRRTVGCIVLVAILIKCAALIFFYNSLLSLQYDVEESYAQVATQLQRRKNIVTNLTIMVLDYAKHEQEIFKHLAETRSELSGKDPLGERKDPAGAGKRAALVLGSPDVTLSKIFAVAEQYPDLKLSDNFQRFMDALVDAENTLATQRMIYNERVNDLSTAIGTFPGCVFARIYGFRAPSFFENEAEAAMAPKVEY